MNKKKKKKVIKTKWTVINCLAIPAQDVTFFQSKSNDILFSFFYKNIGCEYSLEVPHWGTSNEYPQAMFMRRNQKNIYLVSPIIKSYVNCKYSYK